MTMSLGALTGALVVALIALVVIVFWGTGQVYKKRLDYFMGSGTSVTVAILPTIRKGDTLIIDGKEVKVLSVACDRTTLTMIVEDVDAKDN